MDKLETIEEFIKFHIGDLLVRICQLESDNAFLKREVERLSGIKEQR